MLTVHYDFCLVSSKQFILELVDFGAWLGWVALALWQEDVGLSGYNVGVLTEDVSHGALAKGLDLAVAQGGCGGKRLLIECLTG